MAIVAGIICCAVAGGAWWYHKLPDYRIIIGGKSITRLLSHDAKVVQREILDAIAPLGADLAPDQSSADFTCVREYAHSFDLPADARNAAKSSGVIFSGEMKCTSYLCDGGMFHMNENGLVSWFPAKTKDFSSGSVIGVRPDRVGIETWLKAHFFSKMQIRENFIRN